MLKIVHIFGVRQVHDVDIWNFPPLYTLKNQYNCYKLFFELLIGKKLEVFKAMS